jgi:hypothetical protein
VTVTSTVPAVVVAGEIAVSEVSLAVLLPVTSVAGTPPKSTAVAPLRFVPVTVTVVPPAVEPESGATLVIVGAEESVLKLNTAPGVHVVPPSVEVHTVKKYVVPGVTAGMPVAEESAAENDAPAPCAPRSAVEYTLEGSVGLAVENVLVETQNELSVAAVPLFIAFSVALLDVIAVAGSVVGAVEADAIAAHAESATTSAIPAAGIKISFPDFITRF